MSMPNSEQVREMPGNRLSNEIGVRGDLGSKNTQGCRVFSICETIAWLTMSRGASSPQRVVVRHESMAGAVDEFRPFAAHCLGDQAAAAPSDVQHGGMKLHELHIADFGPRR